MDEFTTMQDLEEAMTHGITFGGEYTETGRQLASMKRQSDILEEIMTSKTSQTP